MYRILFFITFILISQMGICQERGDEGSPKQREKIRELAKLKLIENLNLNEEESIRFFARFNEFQKNIENLQKRKNETIDEIHKMIKEGEKNFAENKYDENIKRLADLGIEEVKLRANFLTSLQDILPKFKIAKIIIFEREFNRQLRNLMEKRKFNRPE